MSLRALKFLQKAFGHYENWHYVECRLISDTMKTADINGGMRVLRCYECVASNLHFAEAGVKASEAAQECKLSANHIDFWMITLLNLLYSTHFNRCFDGLSINSMLIVRRLHARCGYSANICFTAFRFVPRYYWSTTFSTGTNFMIEETTHTRYTTINWWECVKSR